MDFKEKILKIVEYNIKDIDQWIKGEVDLDIKDLSGHGTSVLSIIFNEIGNLFDIKFYIAKILDKDNLSNSICLVEAVNWMVNSIEPKVINISLSCGYDKNIDRLYELSTIAKEKNIKIFCSANGYFSYPAEFDNVNTIGDLGLIRHRVEKTKVDYIVKDIFIKVYKSGRWVKEDMCTSYASPLALSEYLRRLEVF